MSQTIKCPHCHQPVEITEAIKTELEEKILKETELKHQQEIKDLKEAIKKEAINQAHQDYLSKIETVKAEAELQAKQNKELRDQLTDLLRQMRELKDHDANRELEFQKKLTDEQNLIKRQAKLEAIEESQLQIAERDKQLHDLQKQLTEAQRKLTQGSQQLQGEVQELKLEDQLRQDFPFDEIKEVPKGINGADIIQIVKTNTGTTCGTIVWESKNTKAWTQGWIQKLKEDQRALKAELAVIVTTTLPNHIHMFGVEEGICLTHISTALSVAYLLRQQLIRVHNVSIANQGKATKAEIVYNYLISNDFKQRIETWVEYFHEQRETLDKERAYFAKKWDKEDKALVKLMNNTAGIYGDLQGLIGTALPKVSYLELTEGETE